MTNSLQLCSSLIFDAGLHNGIHQDTLHTYLNNRDEVMAGTYAVLLEHVWYKVLFSVIKVNFRPYMYTIKELTNGSVDYDGFLVQLQNIFL